MLTFRLSIGSYSELIKSVSVRGAKSKATRIYWNKNVPHVDFVRLTCLDTGITYAYCTVGSFASWID